MGFNRRQQKRRRYVDSCEPRVFTDWLPSVIPAQARITARARRAAARSIGDHCRPVSGVAVEFVAYTDEVLTEGPPPVRVLGIDETRRGKRPSGAEPCRIACRTTVPAEHVAGADGQGGQIQVVVAQDVPSHHVAGRNGGTLFGNLVEHKHSCPVG